MMGATKGLHDRHRGPGRPVGGVGLHPGSPRVREDPIVIIRDVLVGMPDPTVLAYSIGFLTGNRYVIYSSAVLGNHTDHRPDKWYFRPSPITPGIIAGRPFDTAPDVEEGARLADGS